MKKNRQSLKLVGFLIMFGLFGSNILMAQSDNDTLSDLTTDVGTLVPAFNRAITTYYLTVPVSTTTVNLTATAEDVGAIVTGDGAIALTAGQAKAEVVVTAANSDIQTYTVYIDSASCYTPAFNDRANLILDATFSSATLADGGYSGWGPTGIVSGGGQYCGIGSAYVRGSCWPDGGSIDMGLNAANGNALEPNSAYRLRAMIRSQASSGTIFQLEVGGYDGNNSIYFDIDTTNGWVQFDTVFQTGSTITEKGIYFNSCAGDQGKTSPPVTDSCFIDNYELYKVGNDATLSDLTVDVGTLVPTFSSDITSYAVNVPATTTSVTVTATANDAISTVSGDGVIALTAGVGTAEVVVTPESGLTKTYTITFSSTQSSDASLSDISLDVPSVFTPVFDPATLTYDVAVAKGTDTVLISATTNHAAATVAYNNDTVDVSSGSGTSTILVTAEDGTEQTYTLNIAYEDTSCFVPLFTDRTNMIPDPYLNSLDGFGGWGHKTIVYGAEAYCGLASVKFEGVTNSWPDGAAMDVTGVSWEANSVYRVRFMYKTIDGTLALKADQTDPNFMITLPETGGGWVEFDTVFQTGNSPGTSYFTINNVDAGATGLNAYIDNYELYKLSNDATLSDLQVGGTTIAGFKADSMVYTVELAFGTTNVPDVTPTTNSTSATFGIDTAATLSDTTVIVVTAEDEITTETYKVAFTVAAPLSDDATLSDLKVDGTSIAGFKADSMVYTVELAFGTTDVPDVTPTTNVTSATFGIDTAATLSDTTVVVVTAEDGITTETYKVAFTVAAASDDATLSDLQVDGTTVAGFAAATESYDVELAAGTTTVPTVVATTTDANAEAVVTDATELPGATTVLVTAEDGTTTKTYTINFTVNIISVSEIEEGSIVVYPTISNGNFTVITESETSVIKVYDINGKFIFEERSKSYEHKLTIPNAGMYIVKVESNDAARTFKLFVK